MKKNFLTLTFLLLAFGLAYSDEATVTEDDSVDKVFPIKIEAAAPTATVKSWKHTKVSVKIANPNDSLQYIGTEICGMHGVTDWMSSEKFVHVQGGGSICGSRIFPPKEIILKPGETYEQNCTVSFAKESVNSGPLTFRIGLKTPGHLPAWSNDMTIDVRGGNEEQKAEWRKTAAYLEDFAKAEDVSSAPDGIVKRFYESGEIYDERSVKNGKLDGPVKYYFKNGKLSKEAVYVAGKNTHWVDYNPDGSVQFDSTPLDKALMGQ